MCPTHASSISELHLNYSTFIAYYDSLLHHEDTVSWIDGQGDVQGDVLRAPNTRVTPGQKSLLAVLKLSPAFGVYLIGYLKISEKNDG